MTAKLSLKKEYEEYTTGKGVKLKIYPISAQLIENIATPYDKDKPKRGFVTMKVKGGGEQKRPIKQGDEQWEQYQEELEQWQEKCDDFRNAVGMVSAIRDSVTYPQEIDSSSFEPYTKLLIDQKFLILPENEWELKFMWLRDTILGGHDEIQIQWILRKFAGLPEEVIEQQKSRFWSILSGQTLSPVAQRDSSSAGEQEVSEQGEPVLEIQQNGREEW